METIESILDKFKQNKISTQITITGELVQVDTIDTVWRKYFRREGTDLLSILQMMNVLLESEGCF